MIANPWIERFNKLWTDADIDAAIAIEARVVSLAGEDVGLHVAMLRAELEHFFLPDAQTRTAIRKFISCAKGHAQRFFASEAVYISGLYSRSPWSAEFVAAICLTGLAGVGKSQLIKAMCRLLGGLSGVINVHGISEIPLIASDRLSLRDGFGLSSVLRERSPEAAPNGLFMAKEDKPSVGGRGEKLLEAARRSCFRRGVCLTIIDEFQFVSYSDAANARAASVLLKLLGIGPQLIFCCNYSLVHKLMRRQQEDRDRLLSKPEIIMPLSADDSDWKAYLAAVKSIAPDVFQFDPISAAGKIHFFTFGIKRFVVDLVLIAYGKSANRIVGMEELRVAFGSFEYTVHREDVEILHSQEISKKRERFDLWCPFTTTIDPIRASTPHEPRTKFKKAVEDGLLKSAMTKDEAAGLAHLADEETTLPSIAKIGRPPSPQATKEELRAGAALLGNLTR